MSNKKVKYTTKQLDRELQVEPICGNFSFIDFDNTPSFQRPSSTYMPREQFILDTDEQNKGEDYRKFVITGETRRIPADHGDYVRNSNKSSGRGFGDVNISQELRYGSDTRQQKKMATQTDLSNFKVGDNMFTNFNYTGTNMEKPVSPEIMHLVGKNCGMVPWSRGGIDTRNLDKYRK